MDLKNFPLESLRIPGVPGPPVALQSPCEMLGDSPPDIWDLVDP